MPRTGENIYKRKDGRWEGRYMKEHTAGKTCYGYIYGKSYKEVKVRLNQARAEWESKRYTAKKKNDDLFSNIAKEWLAGSRQFFKESTFVKYDNLLRLHILPEMGKCYMGEITNERIDSFISDLLDAGGAKGEGLSVKTVSDILSLLRSIQKFALKRNVDVKFTSCSLPIKVSRKQLRVFTIREQQIIYQYLKSDITLSNLGIMLCLFTGIRIGELCALKWNDISIADKTVFIHQTMQRLRTSDSDAGKTKIMITEPKSSCSVRMVPLPDVIIEEIRRMHPCQDAFFLTGDNMKFIEPRTMQNRFKAVLKNCNIDDANFHTLRHTFATRCVEAGFDLKSLSEILGHASVNITLNRYVHPTMELKQENMSKLSDLFSVK